MEEDDLGRLQLLGVRTAVDLRTDEEALRRPSRVDTICECRSLPIDPYGEDALPVEEQIARGELDRFGVAEMVELYLGMACRHAGQFATLTAILADGGAHAVVFHCAAGKDRTGIAAALVLDLLGVPHARIALDYELSGRFLDLDAGPLMRAIRSRGLPTEAFEAFLRPRRVVMLRFLAVLTEEFGGAERFLVEEGDMDPEIPPRLREMLLEP
ncbi:MAG: hypothetical protein KatS3mg008_1127 [Acidimicrobiales bacterium]|nr:MAG: hypothetical protein KatS3mg008_1127 [Acidimicrobiales bacterium]